MNYLFRRKCYFSNLLELSWAQLTQLARRELEIRELARWKRQKMISARAAGPASVFLFDVFYETTVSLRNHDDDDNKNPTTLHIWLWKTVFLHALHVHFSSFDILKTFSFFLRREMNCFAVVWTTWAYDDKCSFFSSYVPSAGSKLISGQLEHIFQA